MKTAVPYKHAAIEHQPLQFIDVEDFIPVALTIQRFNGIKPVT